MLGAVARRGSYRGFSTLKSVVPVIELCEDRIRPQSVKEFIQKSGEMAPFEEKLLPVRLNTLPTTGGEMNLSTKMFFFEGGMEERESRRKKADADVAYQGMVGEVLKTLETQRSALFVEVNERDKNDNMTCKYEFLTLRYYRHQKL